MIATNVAGSNTHTKTNYISVIPPAPTASFSGTPTSGTVPLTVAFTDSSTGSPTSWSWTFGDGGTSTLRNPTYVYSAPGTFTVTLIATNSSGSSTSTRTNYIRVLPPPVTVTLNPTADATLDRGQSNTNFGASPDLRLRNSGQTSCQSVLRFNVPAFSGTVLSARLRCFYSDGSNVAGIVYRTSGTWTETGVNYSNRPKPVGSQLASQGTVANGAWAEFDVTAAVTGPGAVNLLMQSNSQNLAVFSSREGATPPQLVVTTQPQ